MLQVKIRGMRIELGEIESVLASHPGIQDVVASVVMHEATQQPVVVAHATQADLDVEAILETSRAKLPEFMIPDMVVPVESMDAVPPQEAYEDMPLLLSERGLSGEASPCTNRAPHKLHRLHMNARLWSLLQVASLLIESVQKQTASKHPWKLQNLQHPYDWCLHVSARAESCCSASSSTLSCFSSASLLMA